MTVDSLGHSVEALTPQELEVLRLVGRAMSIKEVAAALPRRLETVKGQLSSARIKLGVTSSREAARLVLAWDLLQPKATPPKRGAPERGADSGAGASASSSHGSTAALERTEAPAAPRQLGGAGDRIAVASPSSSWAHDRLAALADHRFTGPVPASGSVLGRDPHPGLDLGRRGTAGDFGARELGAGGRHDLALLHRTFIVFAIAALSVLSVAGMAAGSILLMHVFEHLKRGVPIIG